MTSSIYESIRLPISLFPKKPETNENLFYLGGGGVVDGEGVAVKGA